MGGGPSREENPMPPNEASKVKEEVMKPAEAIKINPMVEEPKRSKEEQEVIKKPINEDPMKLKEQLEKPIDAVGDAKRVLPHKYEAIMKEAGKPTTGSLDDHIHTGIFLNNRTKKYWVEERTGHNCFMVFARGLSITWSEDQRFWHWHSLKETRDVEIEVVSLLNVCWLEVHGRFETSYLTPGVMYEVVFVIMMELGYGWDVPVNLRLTLPNKSKQQNNKYLHETPRGQWIELKVGEFMAHLEQAGEIEFSLFEYEGGQWKRGLVIKGVIIRPTK